jgi:hypothetical protein
MPQLRWRAHRELASLMRQPHLARRISLATSPMSRRRSEPRHLAATHLASMTIIPIPRWTGHTLATAMPRPYLALPTTRTHGKSAAGSPRLANGDPGVGHARPSRWVCCDPLLGHCDPTTGSAVTQWPDLFFYFVCWKSCRS